MKGRAVAPPGMMCIIGVSTSMKRRGDASSHVRMKPMVFERSAKARRDSSVTIKST